MKLKDLWMILMVNEDWSISWGIGVDSDVPWGPVLVSSELKSGSACVWASTARETVENNGDLGIVFFRELMGGVHGKDLAQAEEG